VAGATLNESKLAGLSAGSALSAASTRGGVEPLTGRRRLRLACRTLGDLVEGDERVRCRWFPDFDRTAIKERIGSNPFK
jgi:hypothetical protein